MRVVLDTNVFLSALVSPRGPSDAIYRAWRAARFEVVTSVIQLEELMRSDYVVAAPRGDGDRGVRGRRMGNQRAVMARQRPFDESHSSAARGRRVRLTRLREFGKVVG